MNVDCRWVDSNLEAVLSDQLDADQKSGFEQHLYTCERCRTEIEGYAKVDRLVGAYMDQETARAYAVPRLGLSGGELAAAAMAAAAVLAVVLWLPSVANQPATQAPPLAEVSAPEAPIAVADIDKAADAAGSERAKPGVDTAPAQAQTAPATDIPESADPRFYVTDTAGYSYSLNDFAGSVLLFAVFGESYAEAARFQEVYDSHGLKSNLRILGVSTVTTAARPPGITFPLMTNRGSSLLDTPAGEFVVVGADGTPHRRGLLRDDGLLETLSSALRELGL